MRTAQVMLLRFRELSMETPLTLPKPLVHLYCHLVNAFLVGIVLGEGGRAYIDLRPMLQTCLSDCILVARNIPM